VLGGGVTHQKVLVALIVDAVDLIGGLPAADAAAPPSAGYEKTPRAGGVAALTMVPVDVSAAG
jgi:hypothetical protein